MVLQALKYKMLLWAYENMQVQTGFNKFHKVLWEIDVGKLELERLVRANLKRGEGSG